MIKFGIKAGIAGGTCYYLAEEGVWKSSEHTEKLYEKINKTVTPVVMDVVPIQIPPLPDRDCISYMSRHYWNSGVIATFEFLGDLPSHISNLNKSIKEHPEVQKMLNSLTAAPETAAPAVEKVVKEVAKK